jgi:hypothetical protein
LTTAINHYFNGLDGKPAQLGFQVFSDTLMTAFTAQTAFLHTAKGRRSGGGIDIIDSDNTKSQLFRPGTIDR